MPVVLDPCALVCLPWVLLMLVKHLLCTRLFLGALGVPKLGSTLDNLGITYKSQISRSHPQIGCLLLNLGWDPGSAFLDSRLRLF